MNIQNCLDEFRLKLQNDGKSQNTIDAYMTDLKQFAAFIDTKQLEDLRTDDIERFKMWLLRDKEMNPKTINRKLTALQVFKDYINNHPKYQITIFAEIKLVKMQRFEYLEDMLSVSDFNRIAKAAAQAKDNKAVCLFHCLYRTGGRISEVLQMKVKDLKSNYAPIVGKGGKIRSLFITDRLRTFAWDYIANRDDEEYLFINDRNNNRMSRQTAHNIIKKYAGIAKVKLSKAHAHNFRHLFGFRLGDDPEYSETDIAELLGHANIQTTRIYTRKTKAELRNKINKLD